MSIIAGLSLLNPFGWFGSNYRAKLSVGTEPGQVGFGVEGAAGQPVTVETALSLVTYWACVKIIAQTIGTLPLELYDLDPDGSRTPALGNPLYDLLRHQPNAENTAVEFWEGVGGCLSVWGNSYSEKAKTGGRVTSLEPLRPDWMQVFRESDGRPIYRYTDPTLGNGRTDYEAEDLMHVRGFGFGQLVGLSPLAFNRNTIGTALAVDRAAERVFANGLRMSGWFKYKGGNGILSKEQVADAKARLVEPYSGSNNAGAAGILPGDFDWMAAGLSPADADVLNNRKLNVEDICRCFGVPPVMVGHIGPGQTMWGTGVEHIVLGFMTTGLRPYLRRIEAAIGRDLIGRAGRQSLVAAGGRDGRGQGDNKGMAEVDQSLANTGISTRNEIRRRRGLPPKPGGDTLTVQSALIPIDKLGEVAKLPKDKEVAPGADVGLSQPGEGGAGKPGAPFEEKAYNPDQPRRADGRWGTGGPGGTLGELYAAANSITGSHLIVVKSSRVRKYRGHHSVESYVASHPRGRAHALRQIASDHRAGRIGFEAPVPVAAVRMAKDLSDPASIPKPGTPLRDFHDGLLRAAANFGDGAAVQVLYNDKGKPWHFKVDTGRPGDDIRRRIDLDKKKVDHSLFQIANQADRGGGHAKGFLADSIDAYRKIGIERVNVHANIDVGGYAWAKYGFYPDVERSPGFVENLQDRVKALHRSKAIDGSTKATLDRMISTRDFEGIADSSQMVSYRGQRQSLGKFMLLGSDWQGTLHLTSTAALDRFYRYAGRKG